MVGGGVIADIFQCRLGLPGPQEDLAVGGGGPADIFQCPRRLQRPQDLLVGPGAPAGAGAPGTTRRSCGGGGGASRHITVSYGAP